MNTDSSRPRPLFEKDEMVSICEPAIGDQIAKTKITGIEWYPNTHVLRNGQPFKYTGWVYHTLESPLGGFYIEPDIRKLPDLGTWQDCEFNPHKVKTPEAA